MTMMRAEDQAPDPQLTAVLDTLKATEREGLARLIDWLKIPSISTDPDYRGECSRAAGWAAEHLAASGLRAEVLPTGTAESPGHPVVLASTPGGAGPHVLFYGHYDVQPVDPVDLWDNKKPFDPVIRPADAQCPAERIVARGAVDDKGQVMTFLESLRAWHAVTGRPAGGARFTVLLEGEEESGSVNLDRFLADHRDRLGGCEVCLISDTGMLGRDRPAITYGVRGIAYTEVTLHGPDQDLHSGLWGGRTVNPINELAKVLAGLWDADRRVAIPGFYDGVREIPASERAAWQALGRDEIAALASIGLGPSASVGESGYLPVEREWGRPTAEINGIIGGYTGQGAKTVIPSSARAKVSFRLVADQDPARVTALFFDWLRGRTPPGCRWDLADLHGGWPATVATESPYLAAAARALGRAGGRSPALVKTGGSIPVAGSLKKLLGLETIFMGFGLDDDRVHSPNEKFEVGCFRLGCRAHALFVDELRRWS